MQEFYFIYFDNGLFLLYIRRVIVVSYKTSFLMYNYKEQRKKIISPFKDIIFFYIRIYYKLIFLICSFFSFKKIQFFLHLKFHSILIFFFLRTIPIVIYICSIFLSLFLSISYWKRVGFYIFNYRRIIVYCHWWGKKIIGFAKKQVLFRWINIFLYCIQYLRYANLEKRRFFRSCYHFFITEFVEIALGYYFKRYILTITHSLYYCFSRGNYILKKVRFFLNTYCNYFLLKFSFIHLRYKRFLLLIFLWNYSFLRFFIKYALKLHLYFINNIKLFNFIKNNLITVK
jgi:hypothetical protein